jgi:hypothetical protein
MLVTSSRLKCVLSFALLWRLSVRCACDSVSSWHLGPCFCS